MRERRQIIELWKRGDATVLVTLVGVEGSSYRRSGAKFLLAANGDYAGAISGGCLETEIIRKAQWMIRDGATVKRYSTLFDDTAEIPYGLGCGGTVDLLLEPAGTPEFDMMMEAMRLSLAGTAQLVETQLPSGDGILRRTVSPCGDGRDEVRDLMASLAGEEIFREVLEPPQRLILFGAGNDARPMVRMAALLGWTAIVVDGRPQWARAERFPEAERIFAASSLDTSEIGIGQRDAVVLMTHSYEQDRGWLGAVLPCSPRYLGLLGARQRSALLLSEVASMLGWSLERACNGVFAPVGLDLGGDGAEAIALATIAEVQACCEGKLGASRRMSPEEVMEQIGRGDTARFLQAQCSL